jgi:nucleoside-diphosphate-sugar epimerase
MKTALVCGAGGFIGSHLVRRLKNEGYYVIGVDLKYPEFSPTEANRFLIKDLRFKSAWEYFFNDTIEEVYQLAADMGGAGYVFSGDNDADIMNNSALINLNAAEISSQYKVKKLFFSSSACIYPGFNQMEEYSPDCREHTAYPAKPDSEYGWEKLFSERLYQSYQRNYRLDVRIARFHNIFGPEGSWNNGKEKAPAAICRKVTQAKDGDQIDIWGDGKQTRSFLYIDECLEGVRRLMEAPKFFEPLNIGSEEIISINDLARMTIAISGKKNITLNHIDGPLGVRGRNSNNALIKEKLGWFPNYPLIKGVEFTYNWINDQVNG